MKAIVLFLLLSQIANGQAATSPLDRIRAKTGVNAITNPTPLQIAGEYRNPSKEEIKRIGGALSGARLFIFPDSTYVYCEWADVMPQTVFDMGTWNFSDGVLQLSSSPEIKWDPRLERGFLDVRRSSRAHEIFLVGLEEALPYFEQEAKDDPDFMLLLVARKREKAISYAETKQIKETLMRDEWQPESFQERRKEGDCPH